MAIRPKTLRKNTTWSGSKVAVSWRIRMIMAANAMRGDDHPERCAHRRRQIGDEGRRQFENEARHGRLVRACARKLIVLPRAAPDPSRAARM